MQTRRIVLTGALGVMLGALPAAPAAGQTALDAPGARPTLEAFYTRVAFDGTRGALPAEGVGGRLMWNVAGLGASLPLARQTDVGFYATHTPERTYFSRLDAATYGYGVAADVRMLASPLAGRVDPFASLGAGMLFTHVTRGVAPAPSPLFADSRTSFTLTPGVGARILLGRAVALQGSVNDLMTFRGGNAHHTQYAAGVRFGF